MEIEERTSLILTIVFSIILLGGIFYLGYFFGQKKVKTLEICPPSLLESKMLGNWRVTAKGKIKEIIDQNLILTSNGEDLRIFVAENTVIQMVDLEKGKIREVKLEEVKVGSEAEIQLTIKPEEKLLVAQVIILPF